MVPGLRRKGAADTQVFAHVCPRPRGFSLPPAAHGLARSIFLHAAFAVCEQRDALYLHVAGDQPAPQQAGILSAERLALVSR